MVHNFKCFGITHSGSGWRTVHCYWLQSHWLLHWSLLCPVEAGLAAGGTGRAGTRGPPASQSPEEETGLSRAGRCCLSWTPGQKQVNKKPYKLNTNRKLKILIQRKVNSTGNPFLMRMFSLIYASALAACGASGVTHTSGLRRFEHLHLCAGWHVCFAGVVEWMTDVTTHTSACSFVSGLRRVERGLPPHIQTKFELLCFDKAAFITGWLCSGSSLSSLSLTLRYSDSSAAPEEEFNPIKTAADSSGGL